MRSGPSMATKNAPSSKKPQLARGHRQKRAGELVNTRVGRLRSSVRSAFDLTSSRRCTVAARPGRPVQQIGCVSQVNAQGHSQFRREPRDIEQLKVRNTQGGMIPLGTVVKLEPRCSVYIMLLDHNWAASDPLRHRR
jgi:hypothetical protein